MYVQKKDQLYSLNIFQVIDSENYGYWNARKLVFQNTLRESTGSQVLNTAETTMEALLSELSIDPRHIELENISVSEISKVRTVWQNVECRLHVFSSRDEKNLRSVFHCHFLKNRKHFLEFSVHFQNQHKVFSILKKKMTFIS